MTNNDDELLAALDRRFSVSGECRSLPLDLAPPPPPETVGGVMLKDTYRQINLQRREGSKPVSSPGNPICRKTKTAHRFNRLSNRNGKYRLRCRDCCNIRIITREAYEGFDVTVAAVEPQP